MFGKACVGAADVIGIKFNQIMSQTSNQECEIRQMADKANDTAMSRAERKPLYIFGKLLKLELSELLYTVPGLLNFESKPKKNLLGLLLFF